MRCDNIYPSYVKVKMTKKRKPFEYMSMPVCLISSIIVIEVLYRIDNINVFHCSFRLSKRTVLYLQLTTCRFASTTQYFSSSWDCTPRTSSLVESQWMPHLLIQHFVDPQPNLSNRCPDYLLSTKPPPAMTFFPR